jgi:hypothetical protein
VQRGGLAEPKQGSVQLVEPMILFNAAVEMVTREPERVDAALF